MLKSKFKIVVPSLIIMLVIILNISPTQGQVVEKLPDPQYFGPISLETDNAKSLMYIVLEGTREILVWDLEGEAQQNNIELDSPVHGLALASQGNQLLVLTGSDAGKVEIFHCETLELVDQISVGHTPVVAKVSPKGDILYVANRFSSDISVISLDSGQVVTTIPVLREPTAMELSSDGKYLFVANLLPVGPANVAPIAACVSVIDTESLEVRHIRLANGSTGLRGMTISPDGQFVYVTHLLSRYHYPITQLDRGWVNTNAVSIIDVASQSHLATFLLDSVDLGAPNPWAIACSDNGQYLLVTHAGSHELSIIDRQVLHSKIRQRQRGTIPIQDDLTFLYQMRKRVKLPGKGPRASIVVDSDIYIAEYFSESLAKVTFDLDEPIITSYSLIAESHEFEEDPIRRGQLIFNDATQVFQQWQTCASCHFDGRVDGLAWDQMNDGIGTPSVTANLVVSYETPPMMVTGIVPTAEIAVRDSLGVVPEADAIAVDNYLRWLTPIPSPYLVDGELTAKAKQGETLFVEIGCAQCHSGEYFTDGLMYDVGSKSKYRENTSFVTSSLIETWRKAPYFHDGRTDSLHEVVSFFVDYLKKDLTNTDIDDIVHYILSL